MKRFTLALSAALAISLGSIAIASQPAYAVKLRDGKNYFVQPPSLVDAMTTRNTIYVWGATYYFTINLPANAGEPLQRVTFKQAEGGENVQFDLSDTRVFEGDRSQPGNAITIQNASYDKDTSTVSLTFDPPIAPGRTLVIGLRPYNNPRYSGVYLFGVTAFPQGGDAAHGQFLGFGRLQFYDRTSFNGWW